MNADGAVYGRFGTRDGGPYEAEDLISTTAFRAAMRGALLLHDAYPENAAVLEGKRARPLPWRTIEDVPVPRRSGMGSCYHCHHVAEGLGRVAVDRGEPVSDRVLWPFPTSDRVGIRLDVDAQDRVAAVDAGSIAARAGLRAGDRITHLGGQAILSHADVQWVLHHAEEDGGLDVRLERDDAEVAARLTLIGGWRRGDGSWRESRRTLRPGFSAARVSDDERAKVGVAPGGMALRVGRTFGRGLVRGGVLRGDVIVAFDGESPDWTEEDLLAAIRQRRRVGDRFRLDVLRDGEARSLELTVP